MNPSFNGTRIIHYVLALTALTSGGVLYGFSGYVILEGQGNDLALALFAASVACGFLVLSRAVQSRLWPRIGKHWLRVVAALLWLPLALVVLASSTLIGGFSLLEAVTHVSPQKGRTLETTLRDTRIYVAYIGDQGALGSSGVGVYQEKELNSWLARKRLLCDSREFGDSVEYRLVDDHAIECVGENARKRVTLPY